MPTAARSLTDPARALAEAGGFLAARPVLHNVILTLLDDRATTGREGRYWVVERDREVVGVAMQSPLHFSAAITPMDGDALDVLVESMSADAPDLPGVIGEAATAAAFAGRWCERQRTPGVPVLGMRLHHLFELVPPGGVGGRLRPAAPPDVALATEWVAAFDAETHGGDGDAGPRVQGFVERRLLWLWEDDGEPVAMAAAQPPHAGISRVNYVFTPPERRGRGYAAACVAALSAEVTRNGSGCMLYTDLGNPTSNAIYQRLGYRPVAEALRYQFG